MFVINQRANQRTAPASSLLVIALPVLRETSIERHIADSPFSPLFMPSHSVYLFAWQINRELSSSFLWELAICTFCELIRFPVSSNIDETRYLSSYIYLRIFFARNSFISWCFDFARRTQGGQSRRGSLESRENGTQGGLEAGSTNTIANLERTRARAFVRAGYLKNKVAFAETGLLFTHIVRT